MTSNKIYQIGFLILTIGIITRFYYQFIDWTFNGDEVALGRDILSHNFIDLIHPLESKQSAPPLFLWIQKLFSLIGTPYISLKLLSFICSSFSLILFNRLIKDKFPHFIYLSLLIIYAFNPYIFYNSLTLKQYTVDVALSLIAVNYFLDQRKQVITYIFFSFWCFLSNVGLLFSASFVIYKTIQTFIIKEKPLNLKALRLHIVSISHFLFAPVMYLIFFSWFIQQPGALEIKFFMVNYWENSFMPLDLGIFKWTINLGQNIYFFFLSPYNSIGISMFIILLFGLFRTIKLWRSKSNLFSEVICIYSITFLIHLLLSALKLYPLYGRLYIYIAPLILILFGKGLLLFYQILKNKYGTANHLRILYIFPVLIIISYLMNFPYQDNDIVELDNALVKLNNEGAVFTTGKANYAINTWAFFTGYQLHIKQNLNTKILNNDSAEHLSSDDLIISRQHRKLDPFERYGKPEPEIISLLTKKRLSLVERVSGYAVYKVKQQSIISQ